MTLQQHDIQEIDGQVREAKRQERAANTDLFVFLLMTAFPLGMGLIAWVIGGEFFNTKQSGLLYLVVFIFLFVLVVRYGRRKD